MRKILSISMSLFMFIVILMRLLVIIPHSCG
mgnify:CR=1 FL=1